jgi:small-conductance mechanosensitive channel
MDQSIAWLNGLHIKPTTILATVALLIGAWLVTIFVGRLLRNRLAPAGALVGLRAETIVSLARFTTLVLWCVAVLLVLDLWGVGVGGLWTVFLSTATIVGVGFLATWAMISNVTASLFLAVWRPFHIGDSVEMLPENLKGRAVERNLMFTVLREDNGAVLQIPNNLFFQKIFRVGGS